MTDIETTRRVVTQFWEAMQANAWAEAAALFADDYVLHWPQSGSMRTRNDRVSRQ